MTPGVSINPGDCTAIKAPTKGITILIADDSRIYRRLLEDTFADQRYSLHSAKSGGEAMLFFAEHQSDLVITD